jgi:uncharacterized membrane protein YjjP (DUF1212 family)
MTSQAGDSLPLALRTISPARYKGPVVVAAATVAAGAVSAVSEQPVMDTLVIRRILRRTKIIVKGFMHSG